MQTFHHLISHPNFGLFFIRICIGSCIIARSIPKFLGGASQLTALGESMHAIGIHFFPLFWGMLLAFTAACGGMAMIIGFLFRPACLCLTLAMSLATFHHIRSGQSFSEVTIIPCLLTVVCFGLMFIGSGRWSVDREA